MFLEGSLLPQGVWLIRWGRASLLQPPPSISFVSASLWVGPRELKGKISPEPLTGEGGGKLAVNFRPLEDQVL